VLRPGVVRRKAARIIAARRPLDRRLEQQQLGGELGASPERMTPRAPFKRVILRAVLRKVSTTVIRVVAMPGCLDLTGSDDVFRIILGWDGLGLIFRSHGQELNILRRGTQSKTLRDFQLLRLS